MITSTSNGQIKRIRRLQRSGRARREENVFIAEGPKLVLETPPRLCRALYIAESFAAEWETRKKAAGFSCDAPEETVSDSVLLAAADTAAPQGVLAIVEKPAYSLKDLLAKGPRCLLLLEGIRDPGNLGTMFRTAEGAGATGIVMSPDTADLFQPKTVRATMGSLYHMPFAEAKDWQGALSAIKAAGVSLYAAHLQGKAMYDTLDYRGDCGFLIGNEGAGLTAETAAFADAYVKIPMEGRLESLNAAMAAGLLMYEANRQRRALSGSSAERKERADLV